MGETLQGASLRDRIELRVDGRLVWLDATRLEPPTDVALDAPLRGGGARALATVLYVAADARQHLDMVRRLTAAADVAAGVTCLGPLLLVRLHDADPLALRRTLVHLLKEMRARLGNLPPRLPRLWQS
jgi:urease accessory protein